MSRYHLSEAYAELYSNKLNEDIDDNLRFIDYMQDEDIQEVVESLYWEFRDYGYTSDGAFDVLKEAASDEVLTESVDYLCEKMSARQKSDWKTTKERQREQSDATTADKNRNRRHSERQARVANVVNKFRDIVGKVKNFGTNAVNKAKSYGAGAATAAQLLPGAAATAGKARLTNLLRTGARLAGGAISNVGGAIQRGGEYLKGEIGGRPPLKTKRFPQPKVYHFGNKPPAPPVTPPTGYPTSTTGAGVKAATATDSKFGSTKHETPEQLAAYDKAKAKMAAKARKADKKNNLEEQYELLAQYILEDLIQGGYANNYDSALIILNNLSEETVGELALNYLED